MTRRALNIVIINPLRRLRRQGAQIKPESTHYGLKFIVPETLSEDELLKQLAAIPSHVYKLPEGEGIAFDFGNRECSRRLILHMINSIVWEKGIKIFAWLSVNPESVKLFVSAGLCMKEPEQPIPTSPDVGQPHLTSPNLGEEAKEGSSHHIAGLKVMYSSMRSGQRIETAGDVLVWGHLNPGAEIEAGGSILVAGRLLGVVHAGASGREDVFVWAGSFETPQVRLANKLCYADQKSTTCWRKGVLITLDEGTPVIREYKFLSAEKK